MGTGGNGKRFEWSFRILQVRGSFANLRTQWLRLEQHLPRFNVDSGRRRTCPDTDTRACADATVKTSTDTRAYPSACADATVETGTDSRACPSACADASVETSTDAHTDAGACTETNTSSCAETNTRARAEANTRSDPGAGTRADTAAGCRAPDDIQQWRRLPSRADAFGGCAIQFNQEGFRALHPHIPGLDRQWRVRKGLLQHPAPQQDR